MKKNYLSGIVGALLGGLIATIPWILLYVHANMMLSFAAIFIAMGALKGYELFNGKIDKKLSVIITIVSIISISLATLVIIPSLLLVKESISISIANFRLLYTNDAFVTAIIRDYIIAIIFTFLGISGVITSIKKQTVENKKTDKIKIDLNNKNKYQIANEKIKEYFLSENATNEQNAVFVENVDIDMNILNLLINQGIVVKTKDKYYYLEEKEKNIKKRGNVALIIYIVVLFVIFGLLAMLNSKNDTIEELNEIPSIKEVYFYIPSDYKEYAHEDEKNNWYYVPKNDVTGHSGYINVYYFDSQIQYSNKWIEETKIAFEDYEDVIEVKSVSEFTNIFGSNVVLYDIVYEGFKWEVYYIFGDEKVAVVEVVDYGLYENIQDDGKGMANSFMWSLPDVENENSY